MICQVCLWPEYRETRNFMVPRGLEPRTLRLLAVRSNQLSYETLWLPWHLETEEVKDAQKPQAQTRMSVAQLSAITVPRLKGVLLPYRAH